MRGTMLTLLRNGGYPPMLFILFTGAIGLLAAFHFAVRARRESLGFIRAMAMATLFGTLAASFADIGLTLYGAEKALRHEIPRGATAADGEGTTLAFHVLVEGAAESTSPGILGFSFLALTSMLLAVGRRRLDARTASAVE